MKISNQLKGGIYKVSFGYRSKLDGYATLMSDIPTLSEIVDGWHQGLYSQWTTQRAKMYI